MRAGARSLVVLVGIVALGVPALGHAQAPTVSRGLLRGSLPSDATGGLLRGPVSTDTSTGLLRGPVPSGATVGVVTSGAPPAGGTVGGFRGALPAGERAGLMRGDLPAGTPVGALPAPSPPGARLGDPGPADLAGMVQNQARQQLIEGDYGDAEARLRQSVTIHERASGQRSPEVVGTLEENASVLRQWNRGATATEMETQAKSIRRALEPPPAATSASPASP